MGKKTTKGKTPRYAPGQREKEREERLEFSRNYARENPKASIAAVRYALRERFEKRHAEPTLGTDHISAVLKEVRGDTSMPNLRASAPKRTKRIEAQATDMLERALAAVEARGGHGTVMILNDGTIKIELHR